jgi:signal transduction histidine kinase
MRSAVALRRKWRLRTRNIISPSLWNADTGDPEHLVGQNIRAVAGARVLLAFGNALVLYLDPRLPPSDAWGALASAYGAISVLIAYSLWVWRTENSPSPPPYLPRLTTWLDILISAALIWATGAHTSPFYMWNVFTVVSSALKNGWRLALQGAVVQAVLYIAICLPNRGQPDFVLASFLVRVGYLFVIALVLAHMGQRLFEQYRMLVGLHRAAVHMSAGRSASEVVGSMADSLTDLLQVERVAVAAWGDAAHEPCSALVNLDPAQGERLLLFARERVATAPQRSVPVSLIGRVGEDAWLGAAGDVLTGIGCLLITRLPGASDYPAVLVACNRLDGGHFTASDRDVAELLASHAGPLLETARLQEHRRYHASVDERRRIAIELHDGLVQTLASINVRGLGCAALGRARRWEALEEEIALLNRLSEEALVEARGAINELAPVRLREEGLEVYLEDCIDIFRKRVLIPVETSLELSEVPVPEPTALLLIGLLREGLNNVRKHAQAAQVNVKIVQHDDKITFRLSDDGAGFSSEACPSLQAPTRHYGLAYLRERVSAMGGEMRVLSRPGYGTVLEARVPLLTEERLMALLG